MQPVVHEDEYLTAYPTYKTPFLLKVTFDTLVTWAFSLVSSCLLLENISLKSLILTAASLSSSDTAAHCCSIEVANLAAVLVSTSSFTEPFSNWYIVMVLESSSQKTYLVQHFPFKNDVVDDDRKEKKTQHFMVLEVISSIISSTLFYAEFAVQ